MVANSNEFVVDLLSSNYWRTSLVPAPAVIPAPMAYVKVVAVKMLVVAVGSSETRAVVPDRRPARDALEDRRWWTALRPKCSSACSFRADYRVPSTTPFRPASGLRGPGGRASGHGRLGPWDPWGGTRAGTGGWFLADGCPFAVTKLARSR